MDNLENTGWKTDFIITHCTASAIQNELDLKDQEKDYLTDYFDMVHDKCNYRYWFFGHYHMNSNVNNKHKVIFEQIIRIV